jgi:hypothetical protein
MPRDPAPRLATGATGTAGINDDPLGFGEVVRSALG